MSDSESDFEADFNESESSESSEAGSDYYDGSDASDDEGSGSDFGSEDSEGVYSVWRGLVVPLTSIQAMTGMSSNGRRRRVGCTC